MHKTPTTVLITLLMTLNAFCTDWYVRDDAPGGGDGKSDATAWTMEELNRNWDKIKGGDNVNLARGDKFSTSMRVAVSGSSVTHPITIQPYDNGGGTARPLFGNVEDRAAVWVTGQSFLTFNEIVTRGTPSSAWRLCGPGTGLILKDCESYDMGNIALRVWKNMSARIINYTARDVSDASHKRYPFIGGINVAQGGKCEVIGGLFQNLSNGLECHDDACVMIVRNAKMINNRHDGLRFSRYAPGRSVVRIYDSIISGNKRSGITIHHTTNADLLVENCIIEGSPVGLQGRGNGTRLLRNVEFRDLGIGVNVHNRGTTNLVDCSFRDIARWAVGTGGLEAQFGCLKTGTVNLRRCSFEEVGSEILKVASGAGLTVNLLECDVPQNRLRCGSGNALKLVEAR